jgi:hypothetical protein
VELQLIIIIKKYIHAQKFQLKQSLPSPNLTSSPKPPLTSPKKRDEDAITPAQGNGTLISRAISTD